MPPGAFSFTVATMTLRMLREDLLLVATILVFAVAFLKSVDFNWGWRRQTCIVILDGAPWVRLEDGSYCRE